MLTLLKYSGQAEEGRKPTRKRIGARLLVGVGLGAMVLTVLGLFPGCGSDSTPGAAVKGKSDKPAASAKAVKPQGSVALLVDQGGAVSGKVKQQPNPQLMEVFPGVTREVLEAKLAESRKKHRSMRQEVFPGITQEDLDARISASRQKHRSMRQEVFPGVTQEDLDARIAANRQKHSPGQMILPGKGTQADYDAARQQVKPDSRQMLPQTGSK